MYFRNFLIIAVCFLLNSCASNKVNVDEVGALREAKKTLDVAKDEGAKKYAPTTLKQAEDSLENAAKVMHDNPNQTDVGNTVKEAQTSANRLLIITRQSRLIDEQGPEATALKTESQYVTLREPLQLQDQRGLSFDDQFTNIRHSMGESAQLGAQASKLKGEQTNSKQKIASLQQQKEFNEKFTQVRENFDEDEAEVVRRGNDLVIRLKKMEFPSGKSQISTENYALLKKVQTTIKEFGEPQVTVEGHSDSIGTAKKNKELSLSRANAVKEYLISNDSVTADKVKTIGVGSDRPIASNTTPEGRAENRRIDIIISAPSLAE